MNALTREDLLELKKAMTEGLQNEENKIINFPSDGSDNDFDALIRKAVYYRNLLEKVNQQLLK